MLPYGFSLYLSYQKSISSEFWKIRLVWTVFQDYLRGCILALSPQSVHQIKQNYKKKFKLKNWYWPFPASFFSRIFLLRYSFTRGARRRASPYRVTHTVIFGRKLVDSSSYRREIWTQHHTAGWCRAWTRTRLHAFLPNTCSLAHLIHWLLPLVLPQTRLPERRESMRGEKRHVSNKRQSKAEE